MIPYGQHEVTREDILNVTSVLNSNHLTQGKMVPDFEDAIKKYCNAKYAVASNSATSSLHLACLALGLKKNDIVWTTPITFVASANCALYCGAKIDFVDISPLDFNLDVNKLKEKLLIADKKNSIPKILIVVHMAGQSCDMKSIREICDQYNIKIIEDASHALGSEYNFKKVGSCEFSDITVFSFHPVKMITTGEGGISVTNCNKLSEQMMILRNHGITYSKKNPHEPWVYYQKDLGFNYRMNDIEASLGLSQLNRLEDYVTKRNEIAKKYDHKLKHLNLKTPLIGNNVKSSFHLYIIRFDLEKLNVPKYKIFNYLKDNKIGVQVHYIPIFMQPYYAKFGFKQLDFPETILFYKEALSIPIFPSLKEMEQDFIVKKIEEAMSL